MRKRALAELGNPVPRDLASSEDFKEFSKISLEAPANAT
jgi:hypothetical protein